ELAQIRPEIASELAELLGDRDPEGGEIRAEVGQALGRVLAVVPDLLGQLLDFFGHVFRSRSAFGHFLPTFLSFAGVPRPTSSPALSCSYLQGNAPPVRRS